MALKSLNFTLLVVNIESEILSGLADELNKRRLMAPEFFALTPMVINFEVDSLKVDFEELQKTVAEQGFILAGITGKVSDEQKVEASKYAIPVLHSSKRKVIKSSKKEQDEDVAVTVEEVKETVVETEFETHDVKSKVHVGRVRSGQQIYAKESDLIVVGDVGAGSEVIADGNIHIYGSLRGKALAGAMGEKGAAIFCSHLQPELVSIAGVYKLSETIPEDIWSSSCSVSLKDKDMVFSNLN